MRALVGAICLVAVVAPLVACTGDAGSPSGSPLPPPYSAGVLDVGLTNEVYFALDPQAEWTFTSWAILRGLLVRTLMTYEPSSGTTGSEPRPDLAIAPPDVSSDGMTWTFRLRPGLRYAPPLQDIEVTSPDIVRAILRAGDAHAANPGLGFSYLSSIEGYEDYAKGKTDSISGLRTPDPSTLVIRETHPDSSLPYVLALPTTAPIPPSPSDPAARLGVATGHDRSTDPAPQDGYGRFLVSSGPYMLDGADRIDFSLPAEEQRPASGLVPWRYSHHYDRLASGSITLVPNPSWDRATDPVRLALPQRIVLEGGRAEALFRRVDSGDLAMVVDDNPPPSLLRRFLDDPALRKSVHTMETGNITVADFNLTRPPFDDVEVRRAVAFAMDRQELSREIARSGLGETVIANHFAGDVTEDSLAAAWNAFPTSDGSADLAAAREALARSPYAENGRCADPACRTVVVILRGELRGARASIVHSLEELGIHAEVKVEDDTNRFFELCVAPDAGMCVGDGWFPDTPSPGNGLITFFGSSALTTLPSATHMGASPAELADLGSAVDHVPSVDRQIAACNRQVGAGSIACWTGLDQYLVSQLMPAAPLAFQQIIRITQPSIQGYAWDLGVQVPMLDRFTNVG